MFLLAITTAIQQRLNRVKYYNCTPFLNAIIERINTIQYFETDIYYINLFGEFVELKGDKYTLHTHPYTTDYRTYKTLKDYVTNI